LGVLALIGGVVIIASGRSPECGGRGLSYQKEAVPNE
jgi:hypothetical protein